MAAAASKTRHRSRKRIAALNFLSNISLDGTHRDTNYSIFLKKGVDHLKPRLNSQSSYNGTNVSDLPADDAKDCETHVNNTGTTALDVSPALLSHPLVAPQIATKRRSKSFYDKPDCLAVGTSSPYSSDPKSPESNDEMSPSKRTHSFSGEKHRPKRKLLHTLSISEDSDQTVTVESKDVAESLSYRMRHRSSSASSSSIDDGVGLKQKEVRFIKHLKERVIKHERVVLLSGKKAPVFMFSTVPYRRNNTTKPINMLKSEIPTRRIRHSSVRATSVEGLLTLGMVIVQGAEDGQDVSYGQLLVPYKHHSTKRTQSYDNTLCPPAVQDTGQVSPGLPGFGSARGSPAFRSFSFDPCVQRSSMLSEKGEKDGWSEAYDPCMLDNPELGSGKHRTLMTFPSYMTSVIDYVKPSELKRDLNEQFKEKFPHIQLSFSKFRSLKHDLKKIGHNKCGVDLWTISQAYVYFEKIILQGLINKANRRLVACVCLMLSAKLNDVKGQDLSKLIEELEDFFKLHRKDMLAFEFAVLVAMEFALHVPDTEIYPHYKRLLYSS